FLVEHLNSKEAAKHVEQEAEKSKQREEEARQHIYELSLRESSLRAQLRFIHNVSKKLDLVSGVDDVVTKVDKTLDLVSGADIVANDTSNVLSLATQSFCELLGATSAALYLWDEDQQQYILRAQSGWMNEEWVHAARYRRTDNWIGTKGLAD